MRHEKDLTKPLDPTLRDVLNVNYGVDPFLVSNAMWWLYIMSYIPQLPVVGCLAIASVAFGGYEVLRL